MRLGDIAVSVFRLCPALKVRARGVVSQPPGDSFGTGYPSLTILAYRVIRDNG